MFNKILNINQINKAKILIIVSAIVTIVLWYSQLILYDGWYFTDSITERIILFKYLGKVTAFTTTILICWSFIINHRLPWVKRFIPNKADIIKVNIFSTKWAFILMFIDPIFLAINRLPNLSLFLRFFLLRSNSSFYGIGHNIGILILLIILLTSFILRFSFINMYLKVVFRSIFGLVPFLIITHIMFVQADISRYWILSVWIYGWLVVAILSHLVSMFYIKS